MLFWIVTHVVDEPKIKVRRARNFFPERLPGQFVVFPGGSWVGIGMAVSASHDRHEPLVEARGCSQGTLMLFESFGLLVARVGIEDVRAGFERNGLVDCFRFDDEVYALHAGSSFSTKRPADRLKEYLAEYGFVRRCNVSSKQSLDHLRRRLNS